MTSFSAASGAETVEQMEYTSHEPALKDYLQIIHRRRWVVLGTLVVTLTMGALVTIFATPIFRAEARLLVREDSVRPRTREVQNPAVDLLALASPESVDTQLELIQSPSFVADVLKKVGALPPGKRKGPMVKASRMKETNVIGLAVDSPDPKLAARVANAVLEAYLERNQEDGLKEVRGAKSFVEKERQRAQQMLAKSEHDLLEFRKSHRVAQLTTEQESRTKEFVELETHSRENAATIMRTAAEVSQVKAQLAREPAVKRVPMGQPNPQRDTLSCRLAELVTQRAALLAQYRDHTPSVVAINAQIEGVKQRLEAEPVERVIPLTTPNPAYQEAGHHLQELERQLYGLEAERTQLSAQLANERQRMNQLGPWEVQLAQLTRSRAAAEKSFLMLDEKLQDLTIRENAHCAPARIAERAEVPIDPVFPPKTATLIVAAMMGIMLGLGAAFLQEHLDDRLSTPEEVDRALGLPVLGYVPAIPARQSPLMTALPPRSLVADSYRWLRSSINFAADDQPLRTILITSVTPNEGKSLTAVNLAIAMAMEGRRVILVDADLRRPSIHRLLDLPSTPGLTDVLDHDMPLEQALRITDVSGLRVLPGGSLTPSPAELLHSAVMDAVIAELVDIADVVIFDTPPSAAVLDAQLLSAKVDGVLLVADISEARRPGLEFVREQFGRARARVLGLVFNRVRRNQGGSYCHYYRSYNDESRDNSGNGHSNGHMNGKLSNVKTLALMGQPGTPENPGDA